MHRTTDRAQRGFTLIEMLAVLLIISILATFLVRAMGGGQRVVQLETARAQLQELTGIVSEYYDEFGRYPPSTFPSDLDPQPTATNMGIESLVIALWRDGGDWQAREIPEENLGNSDEDSTKKSLTSFTSSQAFEIVDVWGSPIAYIHRKDYDKEITYLTYDGEGVLQETLVKGLVSPKTGDPYRKRSFQLISAGPDMVFGTSDDVANFEIE